ncbi:RNA polymerase sigma factor [Singulisphaera sp. GP187]|uniref:RNA polymerase sigma factor n=1 Tax=Singulisphaera sp. GP187 TaxID=1882752 RepID=UPI0009419C0E|nr:sigma-70 family RNA polymerase sigma factor [Singulisphaera sp. GP187]
MTIERDGGLLRSVRSLFEAGTTGGLTDGQLLDRFLTHRDEAAFEALVTRHGPMVFDVCRNVLNDPHDAEDAFQATFLILAWRAGSIRLRDSLGSWLFGVARRAANRLRTDQARRRGHERKVAVRTETGADRNGTPLDLSLLHEEVGRLPEKYREPVILCYLEGLTYEAAADRLDCPVGTISVRLMRAKERLKSRLLRRGWMVPGELPGVGIIPRAAVPPALVEATTQTALTLTTGQGVFTGVISITVLTLTQGVIGSMLMTKLKLAAMGAVALVLLGVGGRTLIGQQETAGQPKPESVPADLAKSSPTEAAPDDIAALKKLVESARRRREVQQPFYDQGRISLDRFLDALTQEKNAELQLAITPDEKVAAVAEYLDRVEEVAKKARLLHEAARGTVADIAEVELRYAQGEMELRRARTSMGPLDLESLDRRVRALETKLDLILRSLPPARSPRPSN